MELLFNLLVLIYLVEDVRDWLEKRRRRRRYRRIRAAALAATAAPGRRPSPMPRPRYEARDPDGDEVVYEIPDDYE